MKMKQMDAFIKAAIIEIWQTHTSVFSLIWHLQMMLGYQGLQASPSERKIKTQNNVKELGENYTSKEKIKIRVKTNDITTSE